MEHLCVRHFTFINSFHPFFRFPLSFFDLDSTKLCLIVLICSRGTGIFVGLIVNFFSHLNSRIIAVFSIYINWVLLLRILKSES